MEKIKESLILQSNVKNPKDLLYIMIVPERNAVATLRIEVWLGLFDIMKELGLTKLEKKTLEYIR